MREIKQEQLVSNSWRVYLDEEELGTMHRWPDHNGVSREIFTICPADKKIIRENFKTAKGATEALIQARAGTYEQALEDEREEEDIIS